LLGNEANVTEVTSKGNTLLHIAAQKGYKEVIEALITYLQQTNQDKLNSFINAQTAVKGITALHAAVKNGHQEVVELLLSYPQLRGNIKHNDGETPLDLAQKELAQDPGNDNIKVIEALLLSEMC
jgi:ankyrin repeat protein